MNARRRAGGRVPARPGGRGGRFAVLAVGLLLLVAVPGMALRSAGRSTDLPGSPVGERPTVADAPVPIAFGLNVSVGSVASLSMTLAATLSATSGFIDPGTTLNGTAVLSVPAVVPATVTVLGSTATVPIPPLGPFGPTVIPGLTYTYLGYSLALSVRTFGTIGANATGAAGGGTTALTWAAGGSRGYPVTAPVGAAPGTAIGAGPTGVGYTLSVGINATGTVPLLGAIDLPVVPFAPAGSAAGSPDRVLGNYTVTSPLTILGFSATPSSAPPGASLLLNVSASGGNPPLAYRYLGLPPGCPGGNAPTVYCVPTASGRHTVGVVVTDSQGVAREANTTFTISAPPGSGSNLGTAASVPLLLALVGAVAVAAVVGGFLLGRRRRSPPPPTAPRPEA